VPPSRGLEGGKGLGIMFKLLAYILPFVCLIFLTDLWGQAEYNNRLLIEGENEGFSS